MKPYLSVTNDIIPSSEDFSAAQKRPLHAQSKSDKELTQKSSDDIESKIKACKALLVDLKKIGPEEGKYVGTEEQYKKEMKRLETTCVAIAVNVSKLRQLVEKHGENGMGGRVACEMSRRWHEWWVVPMLKEKS